MKITRKTALTAAFALTAMPLLVAAQRPGSRGTDRGPLPVYEAPEAAGIAWFGTWEAALEEAKRTQRPILFQSAAPQCSGTPGVW